MPGAAGSRAVGNMTEILPLPEHAAALVQPLPLFWACSVGSKLTDSGLSASRSLGTVINTFPFLLESRG